MSEKEPLDVPLTPLRNKVDNDENTYQQVITTTETPQSSNKMAKIKAIVGDGSFEELMKARVKERKEKDQHTLTELRVKMNTMDQSLAQEIKRRIETTNQLDEKCTSEISSMEQRLNKVIDERFNFVQSKLQTLEQKINELHLRLEEETQTIPKDIEQKSTELKQLMSNIQLEFQDERRERLAREGNIMKQLSNHAEYMSNLWNEERLCREKTVSELRERLEINEKRRDGTDKDLENLILSELTKLRDDVEKETLERKMEDDEIVDALNTYTENIQNSLRVMNSVGE